MRARRPARRPAAVIFDMDGLMLDTEPLAARAWGDAAAALGVPFDHAVTRRLVGRNFPDCVAIVSAHYGEGYPVDALMAAWHDAYDAIVAREGIVTKPGLGELLDWLDGAGIAKAVATSTRRTRAPDIFFAAAERTGVVAADCLVLEDSEPGIRGALAAGMAAILVPDRDAPSPEVLALEPLVLGSLAEVRAHIERLPGPVR
jgi:beta-phosphoglucomutase-like phosphatase (HAD superfamily)